MIGETIHVNRRVTQSGFRAFDYARACGRRLNTYVVVNLPDKAEQGAVTAFRRIRHKFRDWLANCAAKLGFRVPPTYVYVFENPDGSMHVNWAVHVPAPLKCEFAKKLSAWVRKTLGREPSPFDIKVKPIDDAYAKKLAKYIFKGTDPHYVTHFHLQDDHAPQGKVVGKRAGISPSVGIKARSKAGFHPGRRPYVPLPIRPATAGPCVVECPKPGLRDAPVDTTASARSAQ